MEHKLGKGVNRRVFFIGSAPLIAASACGSETTGTTPPAHRLGDQPLAGPDSKTQQGPIYEPPVEIFPGLPKVDPQHLSSMIEALQKASHPFLNKIGRDILTLQTATSLPAEFPFWVHKASVPMPIVYNETTVSKAIYGFKVSDQHPERKFKSKLHGYDIFDNPALGISLGRFSQTVKNLGPLAEGYILAKEHITHMVNLRAAMEFMDYLETDATYIGIQDINGQPIMDRTKRARVGMTHFFYQFTNHDSPIWRIFDAYPILILGAILHSIISRGDLPQTVQGGFVVFYTAANLLPKSDRQLAQTLTDNITDWLGSNTLLPPKGTGLKILRSIHISQAAFKLQDELAGMGYTTR